jgi:hypothetical protein
MLIPQTGVKIKQNILKIKLFPFCKTPIHHSAEVKMSNKQDINKYCGGKILIALIISSKDFITYI